jgi:hypothetical protein
MEKSVVDLQESSTIVDVSNNTVVDLIDTMADNVSNKKPSLFRFDCLGCTTFSYKSANAVIEPESVVPESVVPESVVHESVVPESVVPESVVPESVVPESIFEPSSEPLVAPLSIIDSDIESTDSSNPKSMLETATQI